MFERFTERARQVVVLAQDEARALKHNFIGTEHLLLGLLAEKEGIAAGVLGSFGLTLADLREEVARVVGEGEEPTRGQIPFTPRAKKALELSLREALALGHKHIGTEHVLLGLVREGDGLAADLLAGHGADPTAVRDRVLAAIAGQPLPGRPPPRRPEAAAAGEGRASWEYRIVAVEPGELTDALLNDLGRDGWELVSLGEREGRVRLVLKRPGSSAGAESALS